MIKLRGSQNFFVENRGPKKIIKKILDFTKTFVQWNSPQNIFSVLHVLVVTRFVNIVSLKGGGSQILYCWGTFKISRPPYFKENDGPFNPSKKWKTPLGNRELYLVITNIYMEEHGKDTKKMSGQHDYQVHEQLYFDASLYGHWDSCFT